MTADPLITKAPPILALARALVDATDNAERSAALGDLYNALLPELVVERQARQDAETNLETLVERWRTIGCQCSMCLAALNDLAAGSGDTETTT